MNQTEHEQLRSSEEHFRTNYIEMQKQYSKLNYKYLLLKSDVAVRCLGWCLFGLVVGFVLKTFIGGSV